MNGDLLMFALESFHRSWQKRSRLQVHVYTHWKKYQNNSITSSKKI